VSACSASSTAGEWEGSARSRSPEYSSAGWQPLFAEEAPASNRLARDPLRLVLDPDAVCDPRHVVEVRDDLDRVRDCCVVEPVNSKRVGVRLLDLRGQVRQLDCELAERALPRREVGLPPVVLRVRRQLLVCALSTEVVCVSARSVMAALLGGRDGCQQLALLP
jgi:hypothetical protein